MAGPDTHTAAHLEWIGFVRPTGLVVSPTALVRAGVILDRRDVEGQRRLAEWASEEGTDEGHQPDEASPPTSSRVDFQSFAAKILGWSFSTRGYAGTAERPVPPDLVLGVPDAGHLAPDYAVRMEPERRRRRRRGDLEVQDHRPDATETWQLLVCNLTFGADFDVISRSVAKSSSVETSAHGRMERLLRQTGVPAGLLFNGKAVRLISAPLGENSGWVDFRVSDMMTTAGRPILTAMRALLGEDRLLLVPREQRLAALLRDSRKYQNEVSERLAEQVLHALYELLRGFQTAHDASKGMLLTRPLKDDPDHVYRGLLTVVLRMVFLFYAEERDMLPQDGVFVRGYSLASLYERLREDAAMHPDTMDQRFGAWAQLLVLTRMVHDGARAGSLSLPPRHGALFDPDEYRFLEGRGAQVGGARQVGERIEPPLVPDGTLYRVLEKLIVLDGERISYRALDVEHVGSVYETMMGFRLETTPGRAIAIKAAKRQGAPATVAIEGLLEEAPAKRAKWLQDRTDRKLTDRVRRAVRDAYSVEAALAALDSLIDKQATPDIVPAGAMVLQPSEERRRSGSHYTPRELTEPIVRHALAPIVGDLRDGDGVPTPEQILDIKVCDPAMGSGAFLVEACRQLGDALVASWHAHDMAPKVPTDEDEVVFARRLVAQRCLYGVDRNPAAVDLAKLSLWLVTLAREHPLTFLDHALRHGDSLVGLTLDQIRGFHWLKDKAQEGLEAVEVRASMAATEQLRQRIREAGDDVPDFELRQMWDEARFESGKVVLLGDLVLAAFFERTRTKEREALRTRFAIEVVNGQTAQYRGWLAGLRSSEPPLATFHWEVEFPEVFARVNPGFDAIVGNPPFAGKNTVSGANVPGYPDWLKLAHSESHGNADLVAHFFRRAFDLLRTGGTFGLIATNTIAQGDTRSTGLRWICENEGTIYRAQRRLKWPGLAAVVVSVLHVSKGDRDLPKSLDGKTVEQITAFLFHRGSHRDPQRLKANAKLSFQGSIVLGMGFTFDDKDKKGVATPLAEMRRLVAENPKNQEVIFPYIGGEEVNTSPTHAHHRYVINFHDYPLRRDDIGERWEKATPERQAELRRRAVVPEDYPEPVAADWPELLTIVEGRVKPQRAALPPKNSINREAAATWWRFLAYRKGLRHSIAPLCSVVAISRYGQHFAHTTLPAGAVHSDSVIVFPFDATGPFCALQSRPHEIWARFFGSSMKDDLRYTPSDCFETFPFPCGWRTNPTLETAGKTYYDHRAALMVKHNEGLTKTYNRFHDPNETDPEIAELRGLHADMDRAVLDAYGWHDIPTDCDFLLDYPIDEDEWGTRKKPYRYRWPDDVRDEVLARLIDLNAKRPPQETRKA